MRPGSPVAVIPRAARALIEYVHRQALEGVENRRIARNLRAQGKRALAALEHGLG